VFGFDPLVGSRNPQFFGIPKGESYNTTFFTDSVLPSLIVWLRTRRRTLKGRLIHMDNARSDNSGQHQRRIQASRAERLLCLSDDPDLVRVTSSSLDISKKNYLIATMRTGRTYWTKSLKFSLEPPRSAAQRLPILGKPAKVGNQTRGEVLHEMKTRRPTVLIRPDAVAVTSITPWLCSVKIRLH
jgi:hypothetical protein